MPRLVWAVFALVACSGCGTVLQPAVELRSASVESIVTEGVNLAFHVEVTNPNDFALPVSAATFNLRMGGVTVLDAEVEPAGTIPAGSKRPVRIPIRVKLDRMLMAERMLVESNGNVPYDLVGSLIFSVSPLKVLSQGVRVPLKFSGTLPFRDSLTNPFPLLQTPAGRKFVEAVMGKGSSESLFGR